MSDQSVTETPSGTCPNCKHDVHLPGTECGTPIHHGPHRMHLCLCLARPGAALSCPPQMTCQGGTLGYSDIWYLQHGHSLASPDGVISPEVLLVEPRGPQVAPLLSESERKFLAFALDLAFNEMVSSDGFTDDDYDALDSLRKLAGQAAS